MPRGSSNLAPWLSGHGLGGIFRPHNAPPAKRQHSLVDNSFDTNPGSNHANRQIRDDDDEEAHRHIRLRPLTPKPHPTFEEEDHSPRHQSPSPRGTPMEKAEAEAQTSAQEDTRRALLLINELTNLVNIRLDPMTISSPAKNHLTKAALNLSRLLKQRFGNGGSVNLAEEDDDDYDYNPLDVDYYGDDADDSASNVSSLTVDGSTISSRIYTGDLAEPGWTESEYSGPEAPESGFDEDLEDHFGAPENLLPEQTNRVREIMVIEDSDGELEVENPYEEPATTVQIEKEVIEIPDDDEDDDSVVFTGG